jgi:4-hydroxy-tetrahydrodipicolinate reductase
MTNVIITGVAGRVGSRILSLASEMEDVVVVGAVEQAGHPLVGTHIRVNSGAGKTDIIVESDLHRCIDRGDVVSDFTSHASSVEHLKIAAAHEKGIVIGSTGFSEAEQSQIKDLACNAKCVLSPNMSMGVNIMFKVIASLAHILGNDYDMEIVEAHHRLKKDAPSGTAVKMAQILSEAVGRDLNKTAVYHREGLIGERTHDEIGIQTIRGGDIVGEHTVMFAGIGERLEITHKAHNRDNFAQGAIMAAKWVVHQPFGLYDMGDVLGLANLS